MTNAPSGDAPAGPLVGEAVEAVKIRWLLGGSAQQILTKTPGLEGQTDLSVLAAIGLSNRLQLPKVPEEGALPKPVQPAPVIEGITIPSRLLTLIEGSRPEIELAGRYGVVFQYHQNARNIFPRSLEAYDALRRWSHDGTAEEVAEGFSDDDFEFDHWHDHGGEDTAATEKFLTKTDWSKLNSDQLRRALHDSFSEEPWRVWPVVIDKFDQLKAPQKATALTALSGGSWRGAPSLAFGWLAHDFLCKVAVDGPKKAAEQAEKFLNGIDSPKTLDKLRSDFLALFQKTGGLLRKKQIAFNWPAKPSKKQRNTLYDGLNWLSPDELFGHFGMDALSFIQALKLPQQSRDFIPLATWIIGKHDPERLMALVKSTGLAIEGYQLERVLKPGSSEKRTYIDDRLAVENDNALYFCSQLIALEDELLDWPRLSKSPAYKAFFDDLKDGLKPAKADATAREISIKDSKVSTKIRQANQIVMRIDEQATREFFRQLTKLGIEPSELSGFHYHFGLAELARNPASQHTSQPTSKSPTEQPS